MVPDGAVGLCIELLQLVHVGFLSGRIAPEGIVECEYDVQQYKRAHDGHAGGEPVQVAGLIGEGLVGHVDADVEGGPGRDDGQTAQVVVHSVPEGADVAARLGTHETQDQLPTGRAGIRVRM